MYGMQIQLFLKAIVVLEATLIVWSVVYEWYVWRRQRRIVHLREKLRPLEEASARNIRETIGSMWEPLHFAQRYRRSTVERSGKS